MFKQPSGPTLQEKVKLFRENRDPSCKAGAAPTEAIPEILGLPSTREGRSAELQRVEQNLAKLESEEIEGMN